MSAIELCEQVVEVGNAAELRRVLGVALDQGLQLATATNVASEEVALPLAFGGDVADMQSAVEALHNDQPALGSGLVPGEDVSRSLARRFRLSVRGGVG